MPPLVYHKGQTAIQEEAKTTRIAEKLADWVGPVAEYVQGADLFVFAIADTDGTLRFSVLSGTPPLVEVVHESSRPLRYRPGEWSDEPAVRIRFRPDAALQVSQSTPCGGLAINLTEQRRARINGLVAPVAQTSELVSAETFTLCRKYMVSSRAAGGRPQLGPIAREPLALGNPWLTRLLAGAETTFLASISPNGGPDIAHRGGPPGFLQFDAATEHLMWSEYVGDGVFKSAGNIRATGVMSMLVPDLESGDGVELIGRATYRNVRAGRGERLSPLEQHREDFPVQGIMTCELSHALRLRGLMQPRYRIQQSTVTSRSPAEDQAPH